MVNFDKASFLSDQPQRHRPFLSRFLETQMFASLIDNKIISSWGEYDINLQVFEHRIKTVKLVQIFILTMSYLFRFMETLKVIRVHY